MTDQSEKMVSHQKLCDDLMEMMKQRGIHHVMSIVGTVIEKYVSDSKNESIITQIPSVGDFLERMNTNQLIEYYKDTIIKPCVNKSCGVSVYHGLYRHCFSCCGKYPPMLDFLNEIRNRYRNGMWKSDFGFILHKQNQ